ncbi:MAG: lysylphosphatidylglycerol synthase domain-containing protein, partial [Calditrichota bacterium]
ALATTMSLVLILFQVVPLTHSGPALTVVRTAGWILGLVGGALLTLYLALRHRSAEGLIRWLEEVLGRLYYNLLARVGRREETKDKRASLHELLKPIINIRVIGGLLAYTYLIQILSAAGNWLFFRAVGYELPFLVNLFVTPLLYFVYILPISFGNVGVREGAHIFFYGLFGVPPETALMVSFFGFAGALLNQAIGGVILLIKVKE